MAPVPLYTASPINSNLPSHAPTGSPSTAAARHAPSYPEVRPNENAAANTYNSRFEPTPTVPMQSDNPSASESAPPPPQPGAVPSPCSPRPTLRPSIPVPPRPLEVPQANQYTNSDASPPRVTAMPIQPQTPTHTLPRPMQPPSSYSTVFTPVRSIPSTGVTAISTSPSYNCAPPNYAFAQRNAVQDPSHPPGYQQDHHSSFDDKPIESCQETDYRATLSPLSASRRGAGILDLEWTFGSHNDANSSGDNTVMKTAISWAKAAGQRLSMTEKQIWKTINGEEDGS